MRKNGLMAIFVIALLFLSSPIYAAVPADKGPKTSSADLQITFSLPGYVR